MKKYNFLTAFTMVLGICIGSGIFFKVDDILLLTNGNVINGIFIFVIGALCCVLCGVVMGHMAQHFKINEGITGFFNACFNEKISHGYQAFYSYIYLPSILVVIAWVAGIYSEMVFNLQSNFYQQLVIGISFAILFLVINLITFKIGEYFQGITTIIKLLPLVVIAIVGFSKTDTGNFTGSQINIIQNLPALLPIVFLFDGWSITTTIANKIEKPTKAMHLALTFSPLFILLVYILFFVGITNIIPPSEIITLGNKTIYVVGSKLFGENGAKLLLVIVLISILGVLNGLTIGVIQSLNIQIQDKKSLSKLGLILFWLIVHIIVMQFNLIKNSDISEISIVFLYFVYLVLFIRYFFIMLKEKNVLFMSITLFAILANSILVFTSFKVSPFYTTIFFGICGLVWLVSAKLKG